MGHYLAGSRSIPAKPSGPKLEQGSYEALSEEVASSRAGTTGPATGSILPISAQPSAASNSPSAAPVSRSRRVSAKALPVPFSSRLTGRLTQRVVAGSGLVLVDIHSDLHGAATGTLEIRIEGQPVAGGGVTMTASQVALGPPGEPSLYRGRLIQLRGGQLVASVSDGQGAVRLNVNLAIDQATQRVTGTASAQPLSAGAE